jgi:hypothetical protein
MFAQAYSVESRPTGSQSAKLNEYENESKFRMIVFERLEV